MLAMAVPVGKPPKPARQASKHRVSGGNPSKQVMEDVSTSTSESGQGDADWSRCRAGKLRRQTHPSTKTRTRFGLDMAGSGCFQRRMQPVDSCIERFHRASLPLAMARNVKNNIANKDARASSDLCVLHPNAGPELWPSVNGVFLLLQLLVHLVFGHCSSTSHQSFHPTYKHLYRPLPYP